MENWNWEHIQALFFVLAVMLYTLKVVREIEFRFRVMRIETILERFREVEWIMTNDEKDSDEDIDKRLQRTALELAKL